MHCSNAALVVYAISAVIIIPDFGSGGRDDHVPQTLFGIPGILYLWWKRDPQYFIIGYLPIE
jgi:hypothetical protein